MKSHSVFVEFQLTNFERGGAVARILARHVKIEGATSVDISELRALVAVRMTSSKLGQYISSRE